MKKRNSSIELLKIIALVLIVISHSVPFYGDKNAISYIELGIVTKDIVVFIINILRSLGQIGNIVFIICSAYFLLDSTKTKKEKILNLILDSFVISMLFVILMLVLKVKIPIKVFIRQIFPITFKQGWFIGCYLQLYIIHPLLNMIINKLSKKELFRLDIILIILYCGIQFILNTKYYFNELIGFISIYFIVAYVKKYMIKFQENFRLNILLIILSMLAYLILLIVTNFWGLRFSFLSDKLLYWNNLCSPIYIVLCVSLLNIFNSKSFYNKHINYISSLSLPFYLIHENSLWATYIKPYFYQYVFPYGHILFWVFLEAIMLFIGGLILSALYKETLQKLVYRISDKLYKLLKNTYLKIEDKLLKYN